MADAPGVYVTTRDRPPGSSFDTDTGKAFMVGTTQRGPTDEAIPVRSVDQFVDRYGDREADSIMYDSVDAAFREGCALIYIARVVGPTPTTSIANITDGTATCVSARAKDPGAWGQDLDLRVVTTGSNFRVHIDYRGEEVEASPLLADKAALIVWGNDISDWVKFVDQASPGDPAAGTYAFTLGTDDRVNAGVADWTKALTLFRKDYGPGQVMMPGRISGTNRTDLLAHAKDNNRFAYLDSSNVSTADTIATSAIGMGTDPNARYGAFFTPWINIAPLLAGAAPRTVPPSAVMAGVTARSDASGNHANTAVAGENGIYLSALALAHEFNDVDRATLNESGTNVARLFGGRFRNYGYRTLADQFTAPAFLQASAAREFMSLAARGDAALEAFVFGTVDGKHVFLSEMEGALRGICLSDYRDGALYGESPEDAFSVETGPQVNPPEQLATGEVHAVMTVRVSPFAERIRLEIVKVSITEELV